MKQVVQTDRDVAFGPELPTAQPMGHFVRGDAGKPFAILSRGRFGHDSIMRFVELEHAMPFMRMCALHRLRTGSLMDFRLYVFEGATGMWRALLNEVEVETETERIPDL